MHAQPRGHALKKLAAQQQMNNSIRQLEATQRRQQLEDANKKLVLTFYQRFFGDKDITAADQYLAPSYIQHNPLAAIGRDAVKRFFANPKFQKPKST